MIAIKKSGLEDQRITWPPRLDAFSNSEQQSPPPPHTMAGAFSGQQLDTFNAGGADRI